MSLKLGQYKINKYNIMNIKIPENKKKIKISLSIDPKLNKYIDEVILKK